MTDADEVAGKLLGHVQCYRCRKYISKDKTYLIDPRGLKVVHICDKGMHYPGTITVNGVDR